jgi:hypothetical protein
MRLRVAAAGKRGLVDSEGAFISYGCSSIVGNSRNISNNCRVKKTKKSLFFLNFDGHVRNTGISTCVHSEVRTHDWSTNPGRQVAVAATFCMGAPKVGEF